MSAPTPMPEQPKSDSWIRQFWRDHQAVATIIGALLAGIIAIFVGAVFQPNINVPSGAPSVGPIASPTPSPATDPPNETTPTPTPDSTPSTEVRRSTGDKVLTLSNAYEIDLDSMDRDLGVHYSDVDPDRDLAYDWGGLNGAGDMAIISGPVKYETCQDATAYKQGVDEDELENGLKICVRTSEKRYAFVTIKKIIGDRDQLQLGVTVWDPPFEE
jgi:hypothetical protein